MRAERKVREYRERVAGPKLPAVRRHLLTIVHAMPLNLRVEVWASAKNLLAVKLRGYLNIFHVDSACRASSGNSLEDNGGTVFVRHRAQGNLPVHILFDGLPMSSHSRLPGGQMLRLRAPILCGSRGADLSSWSLRNPAWLERQCCSCAVCSSASHVRETSSAYMKLALRPATVCSRRGAGDAHRIADIAAEAPGK